MRLLSCHSLEVEFHLSGNTPFRYNYRACARALLARAYWGGTTPETEAVAQE